MSDDAGPGPSQEPADRDSLPAAIDKSPDLKKLRARRSKYTGWRLRLFDRLVVPAEIPEAFTEPLGDLVNRLSTDDDVTATAVLAEAEAYFADARDRIDSAERRATTLQGTVAIAASLTVAGAGLLLDTERVPNDDWRLLLISILGLFVVCLVACAWRALSVTGRMFEFEEPGPERIGLRAALPGPRAQTFRAAELLRAAGVAGEVSAVKVGLLSSAAWWLRRALVFLALFVVGLAIYVSSHDHPAAAKVPAICVECDRLLAWPGHEHR